MPIEMDSGKAVFSFVPYPWLSAFLLFVVLIAQAILKKDSVDSVMGYMRAIFKLNYYIGSAEGHEYPNLQVGDEVNPRPFFALTHIDQPLLLLK